MNSANGQPILKKKDSRKGLVTFLNPVFKSVVGKEDYSINIYKALLVNCKTTKLLLLN